MAACRFCSVPDCTGTRHVPAVAASPPGHGLAVVSWFVTLAVLPFVVLGPGGVATLVTLAVVLAWR